MKKDFRYYESKIKELQEVEYREIIKKMLAAGEPHEKIVGAIMLRNTQHVMEARHIGDDPKTN